MVRAGLVAALVGLMAFCLAPAARASQETPGVDECMAFRATAIALGAMRLDRQPEGPLLLHADSASFQRLTAFQPEALADFSAYRAPPPVPVDFRDCGKDLLGDLPDGVKLDGRRAPDPPGPPNKPCALTDGAWATRPAFDDGAGRALIVIVEGGCAAEGWAVALTRDAEGAWVAAPPRNVWLFFPRDPKIRGKRSRWGFF